MRRTTAIIAGLVTALTASLTIAAGPTPGGFTSDDVAYVNYVPFEIGTATGVNIMGDLMFVTSWRQLSVYDVSDPRNPQLLTIPPVQLGFQFENEDVSGNDELLLFSESLPNDILHIYDIRDPAHPVKIKEVPGAGDHTSECILNCEWVMGSAGSLTWLGQTVENAVNAELQDVSWFELIGGLPGGNHDVEEFHNGFVLTTPISQDYHVIDVRDPLNPVVLGRGEHPDPASWLFHSGDFFNGGADKFVLMQGEKNFHPRCGEGDGPLVLYEVTSNPFSAPGELNGKPFEALIVDTYAVGNGTYQDGEPAVNAIGCSAHWFDDHPYFSNGGLVAAGYYEHGTRFLEVTTDGQLVERGWFVPHGGSTAASYWLTDRIAYGVDYTRGIDVLEWTGDIPLGDGAKAPADEG